MLTELIQLSERMKFTGSEPFAKRSIHWIVDLNLQGELIGISPSVRTVLGKKGEKRVERGKQFSCPTFFYAKADDKGTITATAGGGNVPALLGIGRFVELYGYEFQKEKGKQLQASAISGKDSKRRENFIVLHQNFAAAYPDNLSTRAVCRFIESKPSLKPDLFFKKQNEAEEDKATEKKSRKDDIDSQLIKLNNEYLTFRVAGQLFLQDKDCREWWDKNYQNQKRQVLQLLPEGTDLLSASESSGKLARVFPHIAGVPNGGGYCPLASFYIEPSQSFGLGNLTAPMLIENAEKT